MKKSFPVSGRIRSFFALPEFTSKYNHLIADILNLVIWAAFIGSLLTALTAHTLGHLNQASIPFGLLNQAIILIVFILLKRKNLRAGILLLSIDFWFLSAIDIVLTGSFASVGAIVQFFTVLFFSTMFSGYSGVLLAFFSISLDSVIYWAINIGRLPFSASGHSTGVNLTGLLILILVAGLLGTLANKSLYTIISESEQNAQRFQSIYENSCNAIFIVNLDGTIRDANPQAGRYLQMPLDKIIGTSIYKFTPKESRRQIRELAGEIFERGEISNLELEYLATDILPDYVDLYLKLITDQNDRPDHIQVIARDITAQKISEQHIQKIAFQDALTKVDNRFSFDYKMKTSLARLRLSGEGKLALIFFDLDNLKEINDTYGHGAGDKILQIFADHLNTVTRSNDFVARIGGDEFVVVLENLPDPSIIGKTADRILTALHQPVIIEGTTIQLRTSMGISCYPQDGTTVDALIKVADTAMYEDKRNKS